MQAQCVLGQEWREGNVCFLGALSVFSIRWDTIHCHEVLHSQFFLLSPRKEKMWPFCPFNILCLEYFKSYRLVSLVNCLLVNVPSYGEHGQCTQKKYISLSPLLTQCRSEMLFFFFLPYTPSLRVCMERRSKRHSHSCTVPGVGRGKCIFSGRIVRFLHMGVSKLPENM